MSTWGMSMQPLPRRNPSAPMIHATRRPALALLVLAALPAPSCAAPELPAPPLASAGAAEITVVVTPERPDGRAPSVLRLALSLPTPAPPDVARHDRISLIAGVLTDKELAGVAHDLHPKALKARDVAFVSWGEPASAPTKLFVQPSAPLPPGAVTLLFTRERDKKGRNRAPQRPWLHILDVVSVEPIAARVWPIGESPVSPSTTWTFCRDGEPSSDPAPKGEIPIVFAPAPTRGRARARDDAPCVDLTPDAPLPLGPSLPPPSIGGDRPWFLAGAPVQIGERAREEETGPACPSGDVFLGPLCARVDDDRVTLFGVRDEPSLAIGRVGSRRVVAPLVSGGRWVVRGLGPSTSPSPPSPPSPINVDLETRDAHGTSRVQQEIRLSPARRHVVVNEVQERPGSGSAAQRFVELVNDGDTPVTLEGLALVDTKGGKGKKASFALPAITIPSSGYAVVVGAGFVDGLGGDPRVAADATLVRLAPGEVLRLGDDVAIADADRVVSVLPRMQPHKHASRGRRDPDTPDDAPDAFGFDASGRSTPGSRNSIAIASPK